MPDIPMSADEVLERYFFEIRCKLLEIAANLDRIERADGEPGAEDRVRQINEAIDALKSSGTDRAERIQQIFSRKYDENWLQAFEKWRQEQGLETAKK